MAENGQSTDRNNVVSTLKNNLLCSAIKTGINIWSKPT